MKDTTVLKIFSLVFVLSVTLFPLGQIYAEDVSASSEAPSTAVSEIPAPQPDLTSPVGDDLQATPVPANQADQTANQPTASADAADINQSATNQNSKKITPGPTANSTTINPGSAAPFNPSGSVQALQPKTDLSTGALSFDYPFEIPAGRNGQTPDLRLQYNSRNNFNDSVWGYGWTDSIPFIQRINKDGTNQL